MKDRGCAGRNSGADGHGHRSPPSEHHLFDLWQVAQALWASVSSCAMEVTRHVQGGRRRAEKALNTLGTHWTPSGSLPRLCFRATWENFLSTPLPSSAQTTQHNQWFSGPRTLTGVLGSSNEQPPCTLGRSFPHNLKESQGPSPWWLSKASPCTCGAWSTRSSKHPLSSLPSY